jgi:2-polyprenyl-3-methyl-5-hydroxy-6-metoxy-1,4-benzoquinol methylase
MRTCKVCGAKLEKYLGSVHDVRYGYPDKFDIDRCSKCGLFQTEPPLTESEIGPLYTNFYPYADVDAEKIRTGFHPEIGFNSKFRNWLRGNHRIQNMLPVGSGKVLDIGCGDSRSLLQLKALGYDAYGIEADENIRPIKDKLGLNVHIGTIEDADFRPSIFDLITANQLIEHIVDLDSFIVNAKKFLRPGGTIILSTPNGDGLYRRLLGRTWINWHVPFHQQVFTKNSLSKLLEKHGLRIIKIKTVSPTAWTLHQLEALRHKTKIGEKNPYWMVKKMEVVSKEQGVGEKKKTSYFKYLILNIIVFCITLFNRILDFLRLGDCLIVYTKII